MDLRLLAVSSILPGLLLAQGDHQWSLEQATIAYEVFHPLHQSVGVSHAGKGKAVCHGGWCDLLIAVPVKSFDSGDSNRDLHMLQVTRGAQFPMVIVRTRLPDDASSSTTIHADLEIQFAGQTAQYKQISFQRATEGGAARISGTISVALSDFKIDPPRLLSIPVKKDIQVRVDMTWRPM